MTTRRQLGRGDAYAPAVIAPPGRLVAVSGTVALGEGGRVVGEGSVGEQARYIFGQLSNLLGEGGGTLSDVIKITTYLTDMASYAEYALVRTEVFAGRPKPASTTVGVAALVDPRLLIEIEALAVVPDGA
jgi:enamine deaminase RidA (YjgF/YER057c/UK114 family)